MVAEPPEVSKRAVLTIADQDYAPPSNTECNPDEGQMSYLLCRIIEGLVAVVDGFVSVLQENAYTIAQITVVGGIIYGGLKVFSSAIGQLRGFVGA